MKGPLVLIGFAIPVVFTGMVLYDAYEGSVTVAERIATSTASVDGARIAAADTEPGNWFTGGRTFLEDHYSPLDIIDQDNVGDLGFTWEYRTGTGKGMEASPVVIDGIMYTSGMAGAVYVLDARTGREIWSWDPEIPGWAWRRACCDYVNRGLAVWKGRVYVATLDGRLVALDAVSGEVVWSVNTIIDLDKPYTITGAPRVVRDKVIIGNSGAEFGVRGYVTAYDAATGGMAWRFFTVPGGPYAPFENPELEMAAKTWDPNSLWEVGGGGTVWDGMAYDPELNILYVGTGNASPYPWKTRSPSGGDNLFLASILALDPDSGRLIWHYQTTPGENWDYTATQPIILADLTIGGVERKVLMQAPKNGFFYVLDRETGELLSAEKYVTVNWASHVDMETGRPVRTGLADYDEEAAYVLPSMAGGHNWHPMSHSPKTGLVYIPVIDLGMAISLEENFKYRQSGANMATLALLDGEFEPGSVKGYAPPEHQGHLLAWDPVEGREVWSLDHGFWNGGILSTAGNLVFQGDAEGFFSVYRADNGELLKRIEVGTSIMAGPVSYMVAGEQYVAVMAGYGGAPMYAYPPGVAPLKYGNDNRIVVFKLGGGAVPVPRPLPPPGPLPEPPELTADAATVARGMKLFMTHCAYCHAPAPGGYADFSRIGAAAHARFKEIVWEGEREALGMSGFKGLLSEAEVEAVHAAVIKMQRDAYDAARVN